MSDAATANDPDLVLRAALVKAAEEHAPKIRGLRALMRIIEQNSLQRDRYYVASATSVGI